ncbi:GerAB/ArcD/ProY family transporter [Halalkalibacter akibai]|uniref:Spore germination protein n=1 Tax=Halalkalibacter akibai (strain ATCC 43226 / DSM 21942 / CIP 109018 / JCM 9157 / 1139) TaxID=1236973 RepID=W4R0R4_HALA3|nr:GerAB/ArcD/ProY family transporter [Halalkalibacter akibai]GAE37488.1 spore germination protein [Halalkalibacter akibai JCM 9157]
MNSEHYQISPIEMAITLISMLLAVGILTLPRTLAETIETGDGWISVLLSGVIAMGIVYIFVHLQKQFPEQTLLQFLGKKGAGKWIAKLLALTFVVYFVTFLAYEARMLTIIVRMYLLDRTPPEITLAIIVLTSTYAVTKGIQGIVHLNLMFIPFIVGLYIMLILFNVENIDISQIRPVMSMGILPVVEGIKPSLPSFLGLELMFFWLAYMKKHDLRARPLNIGIAVVTLLYFLIVFFSYTVMSVVGVKHNVFPALGLAKEVEIVEGMIERFEPIMIVIWIMAIFTSMAMIQLLALQIIKSELIRKKKGIWILAFIAFFAYCIAFIPNSIHEVFLLGELLSYTGSSLILIGLVIGYVTIWYRRNKKNRTKSRELSQ